MDFYKVYALSAETAETALKSVYITSMHDKSILSLEILLNVFVNFSMFLRVL